MDRKVTKATPVGTRVQVDPAALSGIFAKKIILGTFVRADSSRIVWIRLDKDDNDSPYMPENLLLYEYSEDNPDYAFKVKQDSKALEEWLNGT